MKTDQTIAVSNRRNRRRIVFVVVLVCIAYLFFFVRGLLFEAQMSLGIIRPSEPGLRAQVVNKEKYYPPADSLLRPSQILVLHEIAGSLDSLARASVSQKEIDGQLIRLLNRFTMSVGEYRWIRSAATRIMERRRIDPRRAADMINTRRLGMVMVDVQAYRRFYRDSLDRALIQ